jgi:Short C-terminal domain
MFRRRPLLRAAVVGGSAYAAGKHVARKQQYAAEQDERISDLEQQQYAQQAPPAPAPAAPAPAPAAQPAAPSMLDQINQLAALHQQGVLSDDEFTAAKAKLLGS